MLTVGSAIAFSSLAKCISTATGYDCGTALFLVPTVLGGLLGIPAMAYTLWLGPHLPMSRRRKYILACVIFFGIFMLLKMGAPSIVLAFKRPATSQIIDDLYGIVAPIAGLLLPAFCSLYMLLFQRRVVP